MERDRWQRLSSLLDEALGLAPAERSALLAKTRANDAGLAEQLERMLGDGDVAHRTNDEPLAFDKWLRGALGPEFVVRSGQELGPWRLVRKCGEGGMGQVWLAERCDGLYEAQAAIKLLRGDVPAANLKARFARERAVLGRLNHPGIARLFDAGVWKDQPYLVLEYIDGRNLLDYAQAHCPTLVDRVRLLIRIADAVAHAHALLVVHRDLKPSNILVTEEGQVKLLDFGIAGLLDDSGEADDLTRQSGCGMTLGYASPEQITGMPLGTGTDVFALGTILFELLTGTLPFGESGASRTAIEHAVLHNAPRRLAQAGDEKRSIQPLADIARARGDLEAVIGKALRKDPQDRYMHVGDLIDDLKRWLTHRVVSVRRDNARHQLELWLRRNRVVVGSAGAIIVTLALALGTSLWHWHRAAVLQARSERVTGYLSELLASAKPSSHGKQWPTVLEVLERSRGSLEQRFGNDPETYVKLLDVVAGTYSELERPDIALPLVKDLEARLRAASGDDDPRVIEARMNMAELYKDLRSYDESRDLFMPLLPKLREQYGATSEIYFQALSDAFYVNLQTGHLADADRVLQMSRAVAEGYPTVSSERLRYLNDDALLHARSGQLAQARDIFHAALRAVPDDPGAWVQVATTRDNEFSARIWLGDYAGAEPALKELVAQFDKGIGTRSNLYSFYALHNLGTLYGDSGRYAEWLETQEDTLRRFQEGDAAGPALLLPAQAAVLEARAVAHVAPRDEIVRDGQALITQIDAQRDKIAHGRAEAWSSIARAALAASDVGLAQAALSRIHADPTLHADQDVLLQRGLVRLDGELARLQGDLPRSRALLARRLAGFDAYPDRNIPDVWSATLDLAYTQVLLHDPAAAQTLRDAARLRPAQMPGGCPLDVAASYLATLLERGEDDAATRRAAKALVSARNRASDADADAALGGLFI